MLSRAAEALWWTGRYLGRAEALSRALLAHQALALEAGGGAWPWLVAVWGSPERAQARLPQLRWEEVVGYLVRDGANPKAVAPSLAAARAVGREVLDHFSSEAWAQLNGMHLQAEAWDAAHLASDGIQALNRVLEGSYAFWGIVGGTMLEDEGVAFLRWGHDLEAALGLLRVVQAPAFAGRGEGDHVLDAALRSVGAHEAIHKALGHPPGPAEALHFLLDYPTFPRALAHLVGRLRAATFGPLAAIGAGPEVEAALRPLSLWAEGAQAGDAAGAQRAMLALEAAGEALAMAAGFGEERPPDPKEEVPHRREPFPLSAKPGLVEARLKVRHLARYVYPDGAAEVVTLARMAPPPRRKGQRVLKESWELSPPAPSVDGPDAWGNPLRRFEHAEVAEELSLGLSFEVARSVPYLPDGRPWPAGPQAGPLVGEREAYVHPTALTRADEALTQAALAADPGPEATSIVRTEALAQAIRQGLSYRPGTTDVGTTAAQAWAQRSGVCQDQAHVFLAMARALGLPCRYVSGYMVGEGAMHAWVEVPVAGPEGLAWVGFDPTHGCWIHEEHVAVATGRDYADVSPTSGSFRGPGGSRLEVQVRCELVSRHWGPVGERNPALTGPLVGAWAAQAEAPQQ